MEEGSFWSWGVSFGKKKCFLKEICCYTIVALQTILLWSHLPAIIGIYGVLVRPVEASLVAFSSIYGENSLFNSSTLKTFLEIWQQTFMWSSISLLVVHCLATIIAFATLRKHKYGRFTSACVFVYGTISGLIVCILTSATIAFVLRYSNYDLQRIHVMLCGFAQVALHLLFNFSTLMPTL